MVFTRLEKILHGGETILKKGIKIGEKIEEGLAKGQEFLGNIQESGIPVLGQLAGVGATALGTASSTLRGGIGLLHSGQRGLQLADSALETQHRVTKSALEKAENLALRAVKKGKGITRELQSTLNVA